MVDSVGKSKNSKHNNLTLGPFVSIRWTFPSTNFFGIFGIIDDIPFYYNNTVIKSTTKLRKKL